MIKHVGNDSISTILGENKTYIIPKYQREYTWGKNQWNQLFDDVIENDNGYFLGSIICVSDDDKSNENELIDGQQRLTTISILLLAIYSKLKALKQDFIDDEDLLTDYNNILREICPQLNVNGKKVRKPRLTLQVQGANKCDFEWLIKENAVSNLNTDPFINYAGIRRIYTAFKHFSNAIDNYIVKEELDKMDALFQLADKFNSAVLVKIDVSSHKDAYMLFESLNNRGMPLSSIDLIKNILIRDSENDSATETTYNTWKSIIRNLGDNYSVQERFFRQYYNAFRTRLNAPYKNSTKMYPLGYLATKTTILEIYEKLIHDMGYKKFLNMILKGSEFYAILINNSNVEKIYKDELLDLERIQGAPSYLLLEYLLDQQSILHISDENIRDIINLLIKFFVRRNVTDTPNTRDLNKLFMDIVTKIIENPSKVYECIYSSLKEISADDEIFEKKLRGPLYWENDMATRFILCSIEKTHQTKEIYTDLWARGKSNKLIWTIEHIFPEGNNIPKVWVDMIADGDKVKAHEYLSAYVHTLGNLTITGYNSNLSNLSFDMKMNRKNKEGKDIGYKNGLELNKDIVTESTWTIKKIQKRTDKLVSICLELFKL